MSHQTQTTPVSITESEAVPLLGETGRHLPVNRVWKNLHWDHLSKPGAVPFSELSLGPNGAARCLVPVAGQTFGTIASSLAKAGVRVNTEGVLVADKDHLSKQVSTPTGWILVPIKAYGAGTVHGNRKGAFEHLPLYVADALQVLGLAIIEGFDFSEQSMFYFESAPTQRQSGPEGYYFKLKQEDKTIIVTSKKRGDRDLRTLAMQRLIRP